MNSLLLMFALTLGVNASDCEIALQVAIARHAKIVVIPDSLGDVAPLKPKPLNPHPAVPVSDVAITVGTPNSIVAGLHEVLGDRGSLIFMPLKPIIIKRDEVTVTLNSGTLIDYEAKDDGRMLLTFPKSQKIPPLTTGDKPSVCVNVWRLKISPPINSIELFPNDKVTFDVGSGLTHRRPTFDLRPLIEEKPQASSPTKPKVIMFTSPHCGACERAKSALSEQKDLPFDLIEKPLSEKPSHLNGGAPLFWWDANETEPSRLRASKIRVGFISVERFLNEWKSSRRILYKKNTSNQWDIMPHSRSRYIDHLMFEGIHSGKFRRDVLDLMTDAELLALHADDHDGCVDWSRLPPARGEGVGGGR